MKFLRNNEYLLKNFKWAFTKKSALIKHIESIKKVKNILKIIKTWLRLVELIKLRHGNTILKENVKVAEASIRNIILVKILKTSMFVDPIDVFKLLSHNLISLNKFTYRTELDIIHVCLNTNRAKQNRIILWIFLKPVIGIFIAFIAFIWFKFTLSFLVVLS